MLPPIVIPLISLLRIMGNFEVNKINFEYKYIGFNYRKYNIRLMYIILAIDFVLYLFLGFYLENVIPHEYGTNKKWYFRTRRSNGYC